MDHHHQKAVVASFCVTPMFRLRKTFVSKGLKPKTKCKDGIHSQVARNATPVQNIYNQKSSSLQRLFNILPISANRVWRCPEQTWDILLYVYAAVIWLVRRRLIPTQSNSIHRTKTKGICDFSLPIARSVVCKFIALEWNRKKLKHAHTCIKSTLASSWINKLSFTVSGWQNRFWVCSSFSLP